ncbi:hypothetical protein OIO90_004178 [Microbotryomycetes sp. JL221]|nr:hypothetical protein OIO90_004178 [Microbotryomycetes sp. JL221]
MLSTIDEITIDHNNIKYLFVEYKKQSKTDDDIRAKIVNTLIREIAIHSEAEEATVYRSLAKQDQSIADHFRQEHQELEQVLYSLDYTKISDPEFEPQFEKAVQMFLKHSTEEEQGQLATLSKTLPLEDNDKLAKSFLDYRNLVPTRPHPSAPQDGGVIHKALGTVTRGHDKVMEMLSGREFVKLKFTHPANGPVEPLKVDNQVLSDLHPATEVET